MDILRLADHSPHPTSALPSWVPDWSRPATRTPIFPKAGDYSQRYGRVCPGHTYRFTNGLRERLHLRGRAIDAISYVSPITLDYVKVRLWTNDRDCLSIHAIIDDIDKQKDSNVVSLTELRVLDTITGGVPFGKLHSSVSSEAYNHEQELHRKWDAYQQMIRKLSPENTKKMLQYGKDSHFDPNEDNSSQWDDLARDHLVNGN